MRIRRANEDPKLKGVQRGTEDVADSDFILAPCGAARVIAVVIAIVVFANKVIVSWTCGARAVRFMLGQYPLAPLSGRSKKLVGFSLALLTYL